MKRISALLFSLLLTFLVLCSCVPLPAEKFTGEMTVHFVDVGQADCEILQCDGQTMIIDGGNAADSNLVVSYLRKLGVDTIDYMICTHADEDHVGGLSGPLNTMTVKTVFAPRTEADTKAYRNFKKGIKKQGIEITNPPAEYSFMLGGASVQFLGTHSEQWNERNNTSLVCKVVFGTTSFLFEGDAERELENDILETGANLRSDVLKVAHHGSASSTSYPFLREVMPSYAVIEVGAKNDYDHPHESTLSRLVDAGAKILRTDKNGDIIIKSDGSTLTVHTSK